MIKPRHSLRCAVYALIIKKNKILLLLRHNTGWMDGRYGLPAGHLEEGEEIREALVREVYEEVGIHVKSEQAQFVHVMHRHEKDNFEYIDFFFTLADWQENPKNNEPEKESRLQWFDLDALPENIVPNVKAGINQYQKKILLSELS